MKHNIRINGEVKTIDCELGSGIFDKNGKEIFEGDRVRYYELGTELHSEIVFDRGVFYEFIHGRKHVLAEIINCTLEVVGHVTD